MSGFPIGKIKANLAQTKRELPVVLAKQAEKYFVQGFANGGLKGEDKWQEVQRRIPGTKAYKYPKKRGLSRRTRPILVGTTTSLRRRTANSIRNAQWGNIRLIVDHVAAKIHNEGDGNIPARPYMIQTETLANMQRETIAKHMDKIWEL